VPEQSAWSGESRIAETQLPTGEELHYVNPSCFLADVGGDLNYALGKGEAHVRSVHEWRENLSHVLSLSLTLFVPSSATPSFSTPLMSLRWVLRFEVVALDKNSGTRETLQWHLPFLVTAAAP